MESSVFVLTRGDYSDTVTDSAWRTLDLALCRLAEIKTLALDGKFDAWNAAGEWVIEELPLDRVGSPISWKAFSLNLFVTNLDREPYFFLDHTGPIVMTVFHD